MIEKPKIVKKKCRICGKTYSYYVADGVWTMEKCQGCNASMIIKVQEKPKPALHILEIN